MVHDDVHEYVWTATGAVDVDTPDETFRADAHWAVWLPAGLPHRVRPVDVTAILHPAFIPAACPDPFGAACMLPRSREADPLAVIASQPQLHGPRSAARAALDLHRLVLGSVPQTALPAAVDLPRTDPARTVALRLLREPDCQDTLAACAQRARVSARTLQRSFTAQTGLPFSRWRRRMRLQTALPLLREGSTVADASREVGFLSVSAFTSAIRDEFGCTPSQLRAPLSPSGPPAR